MRRRLVFLTLGMGAVLGLVQWAYSHGELRRREQVAQACSELPVPAGAELLDARYEEWQRFLDVDFRASVRFRLRSGASPAAVLRECARRHGGGMVQLNDHLHQDGLERRFQYFPEHDYYELYWYWRG